MYLYLILAALLSLLVKIIYDTTRLKVDELDLSHINAQSPPTSPQEPLKILFFSDLHYRFLCIQQDKILRQLKDKPADLVIFGGDLGFKEAVESFEWMEKLHGALSTLWDKPNLPPILGVWGNHDCSIPRAMGKTKAFHFIENESLAFDHAGTTWTIVGLGDLKTGKQGIEAYVSQGIQIEDPEHSLLITHNPDSLLLDLPRTRLALAGHYHGGQVCLPFHLEFRLLRPDDELAKEGIIEGLHTVYGQEVLISPGIGNTFVPFRFFSHAKIHYIKL